MLDTKNLLKHAERCYALADLSRMPPVSRRLRALAQCYTEQAQEIERKRTTPPRIAVFGAPGLVFDQIAGTINARLASRRWTITARVPPSPA